MTSNSKSDMGGMTAEFDAHEDLQRQVKEAIICQRLAPGHKVTELVLTEMFDTTRTVARSLMEQLTVQGFLVSISPRITRVSPLTVLSIKENFALRKMLIPDLASESITFVNFSELERLNNEMSKANFSPENEADLLDLLHLNSEYNLALVSGVQYPLALKWAHLLEDVAKRIYWLYAKRTGDLPFNVRGHEEIEKLRHVDPARLKNMLRESLYQTEQRILTSIFFQEPLYAKNLGV
ncbi:GntR family transcriptional regulator [Hyphomonas beringensis]|uniref:GntR family transcriptional regulator n=1 Tax=Hyphomonas beringensis TaxID=1280946 RepID=UPI000AD47633|nr:GntR family transcriptional regulator [Hyphomonas beringensis]